MPVFPHLYADDTLRSRSSDAKGRLYGTLVALLSLFVLLAGCGGGSSPSKLPAISLTSKAAVLKSNVKVLPSGKVQVTNSTPTSVTLTGAVPTLKAGDVLYGSDGSGLLRAVKSVTVNGTSTVVETGIASLEDVFQEAHIDYQKTLDASDHPILTSANSAIKFTYGPVGKGALSVNKLPRHSGRHTRDDILKNSFNCKFDGWSIDIPGGNVKVDGKIDFLFGIKTAFDFSGGQAKHVLFAPYLTPQASVHITGNVHGGSSETFTREIGSISTDALRIPISGLPLTLNLTPKVRVYATLQWNVDGHLEVVMTAGFDAEAGVEYGPDTGWHNIAILNPTPDTGIRFVNSTGQAHIDVTPIAIELSLGIQDSLGIASLSPYCNLELPHVIGDTRAQSSPAGIVASVQANFFAAAGFYAAVFSHKVADYQFQPYSIWHTDFPPQFTSGATRIAFISVRDDTSSHPHPSIYIMNPDGTGQMRVPINLSADGFLGDVNLNPNNNSLVFSYAYPKTPGTRQTTDLYIVNVDGSGLINLTQFQPQTSAGHPVWSPDGTKIVFVESSPGLPGGQIFTVTLNGANAPLTPVQITSGSVVEDPTWSPNGNIVYVSTDPSDYSKREIDEINSVGNIRTIYLGTTSQGLNGPVTSQPATPTCSPDGKYVAFLDYQDGNIYSVLAAGGSAGPKQLTFAGHVSYPYFAPDSAQIIYNSTGRASYSSSATLGVVTIDGTPSSLLQQQLILGFRPSWR